MHLLRDKPLHCLFLAGLLAVASSAAAQSVFEPPARPVDVELGLFLVDITSPDQRENTFKVELDVITRWTDPRHVVDEELNLRGDAALAYLAAGWMPAIQITNGVGEMKFGRVHTQVLPDGTVTSRLRVTSAIRSPLNFRSFPFDTQHLVIGLESFPYARDQVRLVANHDFGGFDPGFEMPEWEILGVQESVRDQLRAQEGRDFSHLDYTIEIRRLRGYYLWKIALPLALITAISWVVFWMSEDNLGRRASVSVTGMLTVVAYQFIIASSLPRFPYLTVLDRVALFVLILIALTMLMNIITGPMTLERRSRVDRICRVVFPVVLVLGFSLLLGPPLLR